MAYQHFYSRVPARISLYNKTDGFDTFAHSAALPDEFILNELAPIYKDKLQNHDVNKIRRGEVSPIYSQYTTSSGHTVQSALSYIPRDYTGERSAYLVHSLVLDKDERTRIFTDKRSAIFNPEMFITDISLFNVTAEKAAPNRNYPALSYTPRRIVNVKAAVAQYDREMMRSFIYSVIMCACGGKNVFFRLPYDDAKLSREALGFINSVFAILPYSFREKLSFVTFINDPSHYEDINLKCVSSSVRDIPASKGVFFDFSAGIAKGISSEEVKTNKPLTGFFYTLFENAELRNKFHDYIMCITDMYGADTLDLKTLSELVFLFWQCSGFYTEQSVLPNDEMVDEFFSIFERYKDALNEDYRRGAYKCLERYPREHLPIPESIFRKLSDIYPTEMTDARLVALKVVLDLIHTDAMRDELFSFIGANYSEESPETKRMINEDLCRVFYGGFLQSEILDFFDTNFGGEPDETKMLIAHKLLLAIRTAPIQKRIISILNRHYSSMPKELTARIYNTFFEMLPEFDGLSELLVGLVNSNINKEGEDVRSFVASKLADRLELFYRRGDNRILPILATPAGFCEDVVIRAIFLRGTDSPAYGDYVRLLASGAKRDKAKKLIHIYRIVPEMDGAVYETLLQDCKAAFGDEKWATMYELIDADRLAAIVLPTELLAKFRELIIHPTLINSIFDVFRVRYSKNGINILKQYAEGNSTITSSSEYKTVLEYVNMVEAAIKENTEEVFIRLTKLPMDSRTRYDISEHIRMCSLNRNTQSQKTALLFELCINALKDSGFRFDAVYTQFKNAVVKRKKADFGRASNPEKVMRDSVAEATVLVLDIATEICRAHSDYIELVCDEKSGITRVMSNFVLSYGIGGGLYLKKYLENSPEELKNLAKYTIKECRYENGGIFGRIFKK